MNTSIITYLACICFIFIFGRIFIVPLKKILKLVVNSILGGVIIYIINLIGNGFGFHIGLNIFTSIVIRTVRASWRSMFNSCKIISRIKVYSTVTDFAKFLGLSTSNPFSFEI